MNTTSVPRKIYMVRSRLASQQAAHLSAGESQRLSIWVRIPLDNTEYVLPTLYSESLLAALGDPVEGLYTNDSFAPLQERAGLRQHYDFGFYSYCGYTDTAGTCTNSTFPRPFTPFETITSDMTVNYSIITSNILLPKAITFHDAEYLGDSTRAAFWLIFLGTVAAGLAFFV